MVPTFDSEGREVEQSIARGRLTSVWLGGLVNPQALITSLQQEKAVLANKSIQEVSGTLYTSYAAHSADQLTVFANFLIKLCLQLLANKVYKIHT